MPVGTGAMTGKIDAAVSGYGGVLREARSAEIR